jgi:catalase (peroxidase I)
MEIKESGNHITELLSVADLIQLGGVVGVEYTGGPSINFGIGRVDATEDQLPAENVL